MYTISTCTPDYSSLYLHSKIQGPRHIFPPPFSSPYSNGPLTVENLRSRSRSPPPNPAPHLHSRTLSLSFTTIHLLMASPSPTTSPPLSPPHPQSLTITLKFLLWQPLYATEKPFQIFINIPPNATDARDTNLVFENVALPVQDIRSLVPPGSSAYSGREPTLLTSPPQHPSTQDIPALPIPAQGVHPLFSLDTTGFMYHTHRTKVTGFSDRALVERDYLPEVEALIREVVEGVNRVVVFDWRVSMKFHWWMGEGGLGIRDEGDSCRCCNVLRRVISFIFNL